MKTVQTCVGLGVMLIGCAKAAPPSATAERETAISPAASSASAPSASAAPTPAAPLAVEIRGDVVTVNREVVSGDLAGLYTAFRRHGDQATTADVLLVDPAPEILGQLIQAAIPAELESVTLTRDGQRVDVRLRFTGTATHEFRTTPDGRWHVRGRYEASEVDDVAAWLPGDALEEAAARDKLGLACADTPCLVQGASALIRYKPKLWTFLVSWKRLAEGVPQLELTLVPRTSDGATVVSGRLPPEAIQSTVRQNFGRFRMCYAQGFERNDKLMGRVTARFVIGRDGKVPNVADGGSDIPDSAVRDCVLLAFKQLQFPAPDRGIVTVVYPIMFMPE